MNTDKLEKLIARYSVAIQRGDLCEIETLCNRVEAEADAIGYANHARLLRLHTAAERVSERAERARVRQSRAFLDAR